MTTTPRTLRRRSHRLTLEALETRSLLSVYTVASLADDGHGSGLTGDLRYCIAQATSGHDTIGFSVTGTIDLTRPLPTLSADLIIMGPGAAALTVERNSTGAFHVFDVATGATIQISGLTIAKGSEAQGAGILNNGNLTLSDCSINGNATLNTGTSQGGGIYNSGTLTVTSTTFLSNSSTVGFGFGLGKGGAIYNDGTCTLTNCTFTANSANVGGAIYSDKGLSIASCRFDSNSSNTGEDGGGLYVFSSTAKIIASTFSKNSGAGLVNQGTLSMDGSTISMNTGGGISGGGILNGGTLTITNSTVSANASSGGGGGITNLGTLTMLDSTVSGNSAQYGAGIYVGSFSASTSINSCTIAFNSAAKGGGLDLVTTAQLRNTIIADNTGAMGPDLFGTFSSMGHNLIQNPSQASGFGGSDLLSLDPLLGPLQDNGGPTFTHALLPGSPAIDAGDNTGALSTDQRGLPRIVNGTVDIGAFEVQNTGPAVMQLTLSAPLNGTAGIPLSVIVSALDAGGNPVTGYTGTVTFSSSDPHPAMLPSDYTFTASDGGTHTFSVTLFTPGTQMLTVKDKANSSLTSTAKVAVGAATASHFGVTAPSAAIAGLSFDVTVSALDSSGNVDASYRGTLIMSSSDHFYRSFIYTFTQADNGTHIFPIILLTAGPQTLLARDAVNGAITGTSTVTVSAAAAVHFLVTTPATATSGMPFGVIITALDPYGNIDTSYQGTLVFSSSDPDAGVVLPAAYTFSTGTAGDNGVHAFLAVTLITPGDQTLTVTDTASGITGSATVTVTSPAAPPRQHERGPEIFTEQVALLDWLFASGKGLTDEPLQSDGVEMA